MQKGIVMNYEYPFIALCSSVMNTKTARKRFTSRDRNKQTDLFKKYNITKNQIKILRSLDIDGMVGEIRKEIIKASRTGSVAQEAGFGW